MSAPRARRGQDVSSRPLNHVGWISARAARTGGPDRGAVTRAVDLCARGADPFLPLVLRPGSRFIPARAGLCEAELHHLVCARGIPASVGGGALQLWLTHCFGSGVSLLLRGRVCLLASSVVPVVDPPGLGK